MVNIKMFWCSNRTKEDWCCVFSTIKITISNCLTLFSPFISNGRLRSSEATKKCQVSKQNFSLFHFGLFLLLPVGANARQPLPFSLIGGSSDVIQSQQQRVELSISHGARCRKHTCVLNPSKKKKQRFSSIWHSRQLYFTNFLISDLLDNGLPLGHAVLGHSPGVGQGVRESDVTSVEHSKENKRSHCDRGLYRNAAESRKKSHSSPVCACDFNIPSADYECEPARRHVPFSLFLFYYSH